MDTATLLVTVLGAGGGGAVVLALINGVIKWLTGSSAREREKNTDIIAQRRTAIEERDQAEKERDAADAKRRSSDEYASTLRRQLLELGIQPGEWPNDHTIPARQFFKENNEP